MIDIPHSVIYQTHPNVVTVSDSHGAFDADGNLVTLNQDLLDAALAEYNEKLRLSAHVEPRSRAYPSLGEFADAMYWASKGDDTKLNEYYAAVEAVKTSIPKPE